MKYFEEIYGIIIFTVLMLLLIYIFETNCDDPNSLYSTDCSNNLLFPPKIIVIPSQ